MKWKYQFEIFIVDISLFKLNISPKSIQENVADERKLHKFWMFICFTAGFEAQKDIQLYC